MATHLMHIGAKREIYELLKEHPEGLKVNEIASKLSLHPIHDDKKHSGSGPDD